MAMASACAWRAARPASTGRPRLPPRGAARLGEHGEAILREHGYDTAQIQALVASGALRLPG